LKGFNDLQTKFPDIAAEAYEWDPNSNCRNKSKKRLEMQKGHSIILQSSIAQVADVDVLIAGKQVLIGFNDLQTKFPDIAAEHMDGIQGQ
jgi:hypothetical protein